MEVSFVKSDGSYLWMTELMNVYSVIFFFYCLLLGVFFFFFPSAPQHRVRKQPAQHSLFTTGKPRLLASDLQLLLRHFLESSGGKRVPPEANNRHPLLQTFKTLGLKVNRHTTQAPPRPGSKVSAAPSGIPPSHPSLAAFVLRGFPLALFTS